MIHSTRFWLLFFVSLCSSTGAGPLVKTAFAEGHTGIDPASMSGIPRQDPQVLPFTLTVRAVMGDFQHPIEKLHVELSLVSSPASIKPLACITDSSGRCQFSKLVPGTYQVKAQLDKHSASSEPIQFRMGDAAGFRVLLVFPKVDSHLALTKPAQPSKPDELQHLYVREGTSISIQFQSDDIVQLSEEILLHNPLTHSVDPGPQGLLLPLPLHAKNPALFEPTESVVSLVELSADRMAILFRGPISPGTHMIRASFLLERRGTLFVEQPCTVPWQSPILISRYYPSLHINSAELQWMIPMLFSGERSILTGPLRDIPARSTLSFSLELTSSMKVPWIAAGISGGLVILWIVALLFRQKRSSKLGKESQRIHLLQRREALLYELINVDRASSEDKNPQGRSKEEILQDLSSVYHALDENSTS